MYYDLQSLFNKTFETVKPTIAFLSAVLTYLIFPSDSYYAWSIAVWVSVALDLLTKWFAIFIKNKGIWAAFKTKAFNSDTLFKKTAIKVVSYLVIQILAGLSMRIVPVQQVSTVMATVIYSFIFFREFSSNIENLIEAGAEDLRPLLFWIRKREKETLEEDKERKDK